jgi:hypothetical protein
MEDRRNRLIRGPGSGQWCQHLDTLRELPTFALGRLVERSVQPGRLIHANFSIGQSPASAKENQGMVRARRAAGTNPAGGRSARNSTSGGDRSRVWLA